MSEHATPRKDKSAQSEYYVSIDGSSTKNKWLMIIDLSVCYFMSEYLTTI